MVVANFLSWVASPFVFLAAAPFEYAAVCLFHSRCRSSDVHLRPFFTIRLQLPCMSCADPIRKGLRPRENALSLSVLGLLLLSSGDTTFIQAGVFRVKPTISGIQPLDIGSSIRISMGFWGLQVPEIRRMQVLQSTFIFSVSAKC